VYTELIMTYKFQAKLARVVIIFIFSLLLKNLLFFLKFRFIFLDFVWSIWFDYTWYFILGLGTVLVLKSLKIKNFIILALFLILLDYGRVGILLRPITGQGYLDFGNSKYVAAYLQIVLLTIAPLFLITGSYIGLLVKRSRA
jgi:hypothetical protein